jgi:hypothetical protein
MTRLRDSVIKKYQKAVDKSREALSSEITIYYRTGNKITCQQCLWDPVLKETLDPNCTYCNGNYYLDEIKNVTIYANTSWVGLSDYFKPIITPAGELGINDVYITCKLSDVLIDPTNQAGSTYFDASTKIVINNIVTVKKTTPIKYGLAGTFYSCALIATIDSTQKE